MSAPLVAFGRDATAAYVDLARRLLTAAPRAIERALVVVLRELLSHRGPGYMAGAALVASWFGVRVRAELWAFLIVDAIVRGADHVRGGRS